MHDVLDSPLLSAAATASFERDGFVHLGRISDAAEVASLVATYDRLFADRTGWAKGDMFDMVAGEDKADTMRLPQMAWLSRYEPGLRDTAYHRGALEVARSLLHEEADLVWEFAIMKPPGIGAETPWHQDEASFTVGTDYAEAISFWMPLQDVDEANGCMRFLPGSHKRELLPHESLNGDRRVHALTAIGVDPRGAVAVPMRAGEVVIHHSRTLHGAGPNRTATPRRAYTLEYARHDKADLMLRDHPWNEQRWTSRDARERKATPPLERMRRSLRQRLHQLGLR